MRCGECGTILCSRREWDEPALLQLMRVLAAHQNEHRVQFSET